MAQLLVVLALTALGAGRGDARLHVTPRSAQAVVKGSQRPRELSEGGSGGPSGLTRASAPGWRIFPTLTSCSQRTNSTPFRVSPTVTKAEPSSTWCFSIISGTPSSPNSPCGKATSLERVQLWAAHDNRSEIVSMSIRSDVGEHILYGSWMNKGSRDAPQRDELVFSKLGWSAAYVASIHPRICLTLRTDNAGLGAICRGPEGRCVVGLYSVGDNGAKCCPVYVVVAE